MHLYTVWYYVNSPKGLWISNSKETCLFVIFLFCFSLLVSFCIIYLVRCLHIFLFQPEDQMHHILCTDPNCICQTAIQPVGVVWSCWGSCPLRSLQWSCDRLAEPPGPYDKPSCQAEVCVRGVFPQSVTGLCLPFPPAMRSANRPLKIS